MDALIVSAKYKGETSPKFIHGDSYIIAVSKGRSENPIVVNKTINVGDKYTVQAGSANYDSIITFLINWEEITSYPSFETLEYRKSKRT
jgi:hypothetical protein